MHLMWSHSKIFCGIFVKFYFILHFNIFQFMTRTHREIVIHMCSNKFIVLFLSNFCYTCHLYTKWAEIFFCTLAAGLGCLRLKKLEFFFNFFFSKFFFHGQALVPNKFQNNPFNFVFQLLRRCWRQLRRIWKSLYELS